ncbi:MAG: MlaD family protein [Bacteroidota bacterium]
MANETGNNIRLGLFVSVGAVFLIIGLYMIGKNKSMFSSNFIVKARFHNVNGLLEGNNVRFSGIQAGTVKDIHIINDSSIEVELLIDNKIRSYIHRNAIADLGTEGLMGNKVVNIIPGPGNAPEIKEGDLLESSKNVSPIEMMQTLAKTNNNAADISEEIRQVVHKLNNSVTLWNTLNDAAIAEDLKVSLGSIRKASVQANETVAQLNTIVQDAHNGKGTVGELLSDKEMASDVKDAVTHIKRASKEADATVAKLDSLVAELQRDVTKGPGTIHSLLKDPDMAAKLSNSLANIEKGTAIFNEDMEALKHNFLTRGYFKKQEKENKKKGK